MARLLKSLLYFILAFSTATCVCGKSDPCSLPDLVALYEKVGDLKHPLTWIFTGDSITHGANWLGSERSYPELIQEYIRWDMKRYRDLIINSWISGDRTTGLLADFDWRVLHLQPDIVSVMIGMNDAVAGPSGRTSFETNLRKIIRSIRAVGAIPKLHTTNPIDVENSGAQSRYDLPAYNVIIKRGAQSTKTILVDHWSQWRTQPDLLRDRLANPVHSNAAGHRVFAWKFFRTLGYEYPLPTEHP